MIYYNGQKVVKAYLNGYVYDRNHRKRIPGPPAPDPPAPVIAYFAPSGWQSISSKWGYLRSILPSSTAPPAEIIADSSKCIDIKYQSDVPVYAWSTDGATMYYYADADVIQMVEGTFSMYTYNFNSTLQTADLSGLDLTNATSLYRCFYNFSALENVILPQTSSKLASLEGMFGVCSAITEIDLSPLVTDGVTSINGMFFFCSNLETIYVDDKWSTESISDLHMQDSAFTMCTSLVGGNGTTLDSPSDESGLPLYSAHYARADVSGQMGLFTLK